MPIISYGQGVLNLGYLPGGMLMSTSPSYSLFRTERGITFLDISRLRYHDHPSKFRSMIVIASANNEFIMQAMLKHGFREISMFF